MESLWQDIRYSLRILRKNFAFTTVAVIALALGIGANSTIFSVVNAVMLRQLPYKNPDQLTMLWETSPEKDLAQIPIFIPDYIYWREHNRVWQNLAGFQNKSFNLTGQDEPERVLGTRADGNFFATLDVQPLLGRTFNIEEDRPEANRVVILSYGLWQRRYGGESNIVGKDLNLNGDLYTVIGVMPREFQFSVNWNSADTEPHQVDLWVPLALSAGEKASYSGHDISVIGRLKPDVSLKQAQTEMISLLGQLGQQMPDIYAGMGINLVPLQKELIGNTSSSLFLLLAAVGFVLLIACANVANLTLARATARKTEIAIRTALGATRARIIRQLLTESTVLSLLGGGLGLLLSFFATDLLIQLGPAKIQLANPAAIDTRVLGFTFLISILTGILFGLLPALQVSRPDLNESLKEGNQRLAGGFSRQRLQSVLAVSEIALALMLLVGAGLLIKSFLRLLDVNPGFDAKNLLTMQVYLPSSKYLESYQQTAFFQQAMQRIETVPGVVGVGVVSNLPLGDNWEIFFTIENRPTTTLQDNPLAGNHAISADYFHLMGIPLIKGRYFTDQDAADSPKVAIIDETLANQYWSREDPIGKRIKKGSAQSDTPWFTIIGVVKDVHRYGLASPVKPEIYLPYQQASRAAMSLIIRTSSDPQQLAAVVRGQIALVDKDQPVYNIRSMEQIVADSVAPRRFNMLLLAIFAAVALLLAAVGIYGVMAYLVSRRTHEIGVRMALGAKPIDIVKLVLGDGIKLTAVGLLIGLAASLALTRLIASMLFGISATDPITFVVISLLLGGVALLACYLPARRATKVDPLVALRYE